MEVLSVFLRWVALTLVAASAGWFAQTPFFRPVGDVVRPLFWCAMAAVIWHGAERTKRKDDDHA